MRPVRAPIPDRQRVRGGDRDRQRDIRTSGRQVCVEFRPGTDIQGAAPPCTASQRWRAGVEANQVAAGNRGEFTVFLRWGKDTDAPAGNWFAYPPDTAAATARAKLPHSTSISSPSPTRIQVREQGGLRPGARDRALSRPLPHASDLGCTRLALVESLVKESGANGLNGDLLWTRRRTRARPTTRRKSARTCAEVPPSFKIGGSRSSRIDTT